MLTRRSDWMMGATRFPPPFQRRGRVRGHFGQLQPFYTRGACSDPTGLSCTNIPNYRQIANQGGPIFNGADAAITVYFGYPSVWNLPGQVATAQISPGSTPCTADTFGVPANLAAGRACYVLGPPPTAIPPGNAVRVAGQGGAFQVKDPSIVYYGAGSAWAPRQVDPGSYECTNYYFGPDPAWGQTKECRAAPIPATTVGPSSVVLDDRAREYDQLQAAAAGAQAQADLAAAQALVLSQNVDAAAQQAQIAQNAQAQSAASLSAAQSYLDTLKQYQAQQAALAASIAAARAVGSETPEAAAAAASVAAQAIAVQQAVDAAKSTVAQHAAAYDAAMAATQVEIQKQEAAAAQLKAAQEGAAQQAANAAAGGAPTLLGLSTSELVLYGGIALVGVLLLFGEK